MQIPLSRSFRFRILVTSIIVEMVMLSFLIYNSVRLIDRAIDQQTTIRLHSSVPLLQAALGTKLFERDYVSTLEILNRLTVSDLDGFKYLVVTDSEGRVFALSGEVDVKHLPTIDQDTRAATGDGVFDTISPLYVGNYQVGSVRYGVSIASMLRSKQDLIEQGLLIATAEIVLTLLVLTLTGYFLTRHIGELIRFANAVTLGDYTATPRNMGRDEFGILSAAFERMTRTVTQRIEELHASEQALEESKAQFESIFNSLVETVIFVDPQRVVLMSNPSVERMFGYSPEFLVGKTLEFLYLREQDYHQQRYRFSDEAADLGSAFSAEYKRRDGSVFIGETVLSPVRNPAGTLLGFVGIVRDITEQLQAQRALAEEKERAQVTLESIGDAVITTDTAGVVQYINPVAEAITGWKQVDAKGQSLTAVFNIINEFSRTPAANPVERCLREQQIVEVSEGMLLLSRHGREYSIEDSAAPIRNYDGAVIGAVLVFHDITKTKSMSRQLVWQATHDSLTGLLNRNQFESYLRRLLVDAQKNQAVHALLYLDLDQFKLVNDTCGHIAGDELLRQLSRLLHAQLRESDHLARMGGDEFGVLLENRTLDEVEEVAQRLRKTVDEYVFVWGEKSFRIGVSIGVVQVTHESESISQILSSADMACYIAKDSGRNRIHLHTLDDREIALRHGEMHWVTRLNQAFEEDKFVLYAQKIRPIGDLTIQEHYEVLIRLEDGGETVQPMAFIPAAERYNLMPQLDRWVVRNVFAWLQENAGRYRGMLTINLSGITLGDKEFLPFVISQFKSGTVDPAQVCFEITETAAITNLSLAMSFINEVRQYGASFALDDFGSGLSSFNYLKNLPVDFIKIDGAFVREIDKDLVSYTMVESICHVGRVMGLRTIAEFVENEAILRKVTDLGIDYAQGYGIHRPQPLSQIISARDTASL